MAIKNNKPSNTRYHNQRSREEKKPRKSSIGDHYDYFADEEQRYRDSVKLNRILEQLNYSIQSLQKTGIRENIQERDSVRNPSRPADRVAIFVDGSNFRYAMTALHKNLVVPKFTEYIEKNVGHIVDAYYYDAVERADNVSLNFTAENGFSQILKPVKEIRQANGNVTKKCNLDVEIVLDMMATTNHYDTCVLLSGDSDFKRALEVLKSMGKKFIIISTRSSISKELLTLAGRHALLIEDHADWLKNINR